jgi:hypothetical protein
MKVGIIRPNSWMFIISIRNLAQLDILNPLGIQKNEMDQVYNLLNIRSWVGYNYRPKPDPTISMNIPLEKLKNY